MGFKAFLHTYRRPFIFIVHMLLFILAYVLAFMLRFDFHPPPEHMEIMFRTMPILIGIKVLVFYYFGIFSGLWRYANIDDIWKIVKASFKNNKFIIERVIPEGKREMTYAA